LMRRAYCRLGGGEGEQVGGGIWWDIRDDHSFSESSAAAARWHQVQAPRRVLLRIPREKDIEKKAHVEALLERAVH